MRPIPEPTRLRALIVAFGPSQPRHSAVKLRDALTALNAWRTSAHDKIYDVVEDRVNHCKISMDRNESADQQFSHALVNLTYEIVDAEEKIVIYYGGHALQYEPRETSRMVPMHQNWQWHADVNYEACEGHLRAFNPVPAMQYFVETVHNDVLLIFHCPINLHRHFQGEFKAPTQRPVKNIQLLHLHMPWSITPKGGYDNTACRVNLVDPVDLSCWNNIVKVVPLLQERTTTDVADQLLSYCGKKYATFHTLLDDMTQAASQNNRHAPYWKSFLGMAKDFTIHNGVTWAKAQATAEEELSSYCSDSTTVTNDSVDNDRSDDGSTLMDSDDSWDIPSALIRRTTLTMRPRLPPSGTTGTESSRDTVSSYARTISHSGPVGEHSLIVPQTARLVETRLQSGGSVFVSDDSSNGNGSGGPVDVPGSSPQAQNADESSSSSSSSSESDDDGPLSDGE